MPLWLIAALIAAGVVLVAWWAEAKVTIIIAELRAIRENLDKLWSDRAEEDLGEEAEPASLASELSGHKGN